MQLSDLEKVKAFAEEREGVLRLLNASAGSPEHLCQFTLRLKVQDQDPEGLDFNIWKAPLVDSEEKEKETECSVPHGSAVELLLKRRQELEDLLESLGVEV